MDACFGGTAMRSSARDYIDLGTGAVDRLIFWDPDIYQRELERIFARCWLFVAHESQLPKTGDYITTSMGQDAVIVSRASDHQIRVSLNSCPHRGNRVCFSDHQAFKRCYEMVNLAAFSMLGINHSNRANLSVIALLSASLRMEIGFI